MNPEIIRFGAFQLDIGAFALTRAGRPLHLEKLPMELLILLAREDGRLVSRADIIEHLWGKDCFIDVDNSINTAMRKIRRVLGENPEHPTHVETVVGKGYRLKGGIRRVALNGADSVLASGSRPMLLVLPFDNVSGLPDQDYFSDGLTEETIAGLGCWSPGQLGVLARTTSMAYRRSSKTIAQIRKELGIDYVLEGSVRRTQDRARITVQLIRARDQVNIWANTFDRRLDDILGVQQDIAAAIAGQLHLRLATGPAPPEASAPVARDASVHDDYLRGLYHQAKATRDELYKALECFGRAARLDPSFAPAHIGLAHCHIRLPITSDVPSGAAFPAALEAIRCAAALESRSAAILTAGAAVKFWYDWEFADAAATARRAIEINGNFAPAYFSLAHTLSNIGEHPAALAAITKALTLDPLSLLARTMHGQFLYHAGRNAEALEVLRSALDLEPRFWVAHICAAKVHACLGHHEDALVACTNALAHSGGNTEAMSIAGHVHARSGNCVRAQEMLDALMERGRHAYVPPYNIALVHAGLENSAEALRYLQQALVERDVHMVFLRDHKWDAMRALPAFARIQQRVGLPS